MRTSDLSRCLSAVAFCCGLFAFATLVNAHETWIVARPASGDATGPLVVAIANGTRFPETESGLSRASLAKSGVTTRGETRPLEPVAELPRVLVARARLPASGLSTVWLSLDAQPITLDDAQVEAYLDEINVDDDVRERWSALRAKGWRERYAKFAKSIVRTAADATDDGWSRPVGGDLEIVPERDPTTLRAGDTLPVRLVFHGKPLAGQTIAITDGGAKQWRRTDAEGRATFALEGAGPWLVHGTVLRAEGDEWVSWFTTLTFR